MPIMDNYSAEFLDELLKATRSGVDFDGDVARLASRARDGDKEAVDKLMTAYWSIAILLGIRMRPSSLRIPDAAQEAVIVLQRMIRAGSTTIEVDLAPAIRRTFESLSG
jgi:hypothetical protein